MTTYQTPHPVRLRLKLEAGRIDVITWDEPRAEVEVTPLGDDQASVEAAQNVQQELRGSGESQELSVEAPSGRSLFGLRRGPELRFAISVPHGSSIDSTTVSADVAGRGRFGTAKVNTTPATSRWGRSRATPPSRRSAVTWTWSASTGPPASAASPAISSWDPWRARSRPARSRATCT